VNPVGNGTTSVTGTDLILNVPAGSNHDPALGGDNAVRVAQSIGNSDFTVEVKFDSIPTLQYQFEGVVVEQDAGNFLRFNFGSTGSALEVAASKIVSGAETATLNSGISLPAGARSLWLRIQKSGNTWTETWSSDGSTYQNVGSFSQPLTTSRVGPFAGNYSSPASTAPGFTAYVDYFSNTASPLH
jgi:beta-xylosidase